MSYNDDGLALTALGLFVMKEPGVKATQDKQRDIELAEAIARYIEGGLICSTMTQRFVRPSIEAKHKLRANAQLTVSRIA